MTAPGCRIHAVLLAASLGFIAFSGGFLAWSGYRVTPLETPICTANYSVTEKEGGWTPLHTADKFRVSGLVARNKAVLWLKDGALSCDFGNGRFSTESLWYWRQK